MSSAIVSVGSVNIDLSVQLPHLARAGETLHAHGMTTSLGGKGANQAAAAARLTNGCAALIGRIGTDAFAITAREALTRFKVDISQLHADPDHPTGVAFISVDQSGENSIVVVGGANMALRPHDLEITTPVLNAAQVVMLQLETPLTFVIEAARRAREAGARVILDPAPAPQAGLPEELWPNADILTPNETETEILTGFRPQTPQDAAHAATLLRARGTRIAIVKLGSRGVFWDDGSRNGFVPPFRVQAIDTVAAGDCFNAGLAAALAEEQALPDAVRFAAACGALATTKPGAAEAAPTRAEVEALLAAQT